MEIMPSLSSSVQLQGRGRLRAIDPKTRECVYDSGWHSNLIVTAGKEFICRMLIDEPGYDIGLTWCAIGTDDTPPTVDDTQLVAEVKRLKIATGSQVENVAVLSTFFSAANSTYIIREVGIFGHSTASATPNSGILMGRVLLFYDNSEGLVDIIIDYELEVG